MYLTLKTLFPREGCDAVIKYLGLVEIRAFQMTMGKTFLLHEEQVCSLYLCSSARHVWLPMESRKDHIFPGFILVYGGRAGRMRNMTA